MHSYSKDGCENASHGADWTMCGLAVTSIFDLLTSKTTQFIFVFSWTEIVNLVKFSRAVCNTQC